MKPDLDSLKKYREQLNTLRQEFSSEDLPEARFFLFWMGHRGKLLYKDGTLMSALSGEVLYNWDVETDFIIPYEYIVFIRTKNQDHIEIREDETGIVSNTRCKWQKSMGVEMLAIWLKSNTSNHKS